MMRLLALSLVFALLPALASADTAPVASDSDVAKAMTPLGPDTHTNLDTTLPPDPSSRNDSVVPLSPHCQELQSEIERATNAPATRCARLALPSALLTGLQINASNGGHGRSSVGVDLRTQLKQQYQRECR